MKIVFILIALLSPAVITGFAVSRSSTTQTFLKEYKKTKGTDYNVVENGGWYQLEKDAGAKLDALQDEAVLDVTTTTTTTTADGWNSVQALAADPKGALVDMIMSSLSTNGGMVGNVIDDGKLDGILALLAAKGKGFSSDLVDGEWVSVLDKSGKKSPKIQKAVAKKETAGNSFANFDVKASKFSGSVMLGKRSEVRSTVSYTPVGTGYTKVGNKIVVRRIMCDIVGANVKIWRFPRLPVPLRSKGGWLDFIYMDEDIRITKGNRGGLFVHFRPEFLKKVMK